MSVSRAGPGGRVLPRTLFGRPFVTALVALEKAGSAVLAGAGSGLAFFVHHKVKVNPLWLFLPDRFQDSPFEGVKDFLAAHLPTLGPRFVLLIGVLLAFWAILLALEAIGVWYDYAWGEALIIVETMSLLPYELYHLAHRPTLPAFGSLAINLLILWYVTRLYQRRMARRQAERVGPAVGQLAVPGMGGETALRSKGSGRG